MELIPYPRHLPKKRIVIVNAYIDELHGLVGRPYKVPQALTPAYLAGAFDAERCQVRLYNEHASGPLNDARLLAWADMLVLTGLTTAFDRMRQLAAHARTLNPKVVVVAGGPAIRALPRYAAGFFDYCCQGDIEQLRDVIVDAFGKPYVAQEMLPRFDLAYWVGRIGYIETSRNCNFRCSFCSLTGEGVRYQKYSLDFIRKQIQLAGKKSALIFLDNNFYGNDRAYFRARLELIKEMYQKGWFGGWGALVTNDFFLDDANLDRVKQAGCWSLFSGVESLDTASLLHFNKRQNTQQSPLAMIRKCLDAGILFNYGLILDVTTRRITDLRKEIEFLLHTPDVTLPSFLSLPIPLLKTPFFYECLGKNLFLPNTRLCDLTSSTLSLRPLDPIDEVAQFVKDCNNLAGNRWRSLVHAGSFFARYVRKLRWPQMAGALLSVPLLWSPSLTNSPFAWLKSCKNRPQRRTHVSSTEPLHPIYKPTLPLADRYAHYFQPTMVSDAKGQLAEPLWEDLRKRAVA